MIIEEIEFVHCCYYDKRYIRLIDIGRLKLQRAIGTDIQ